jgi:hypothetical protein
MIPAEDFPTWHNHPNHIVGFPPGTLRGARLHSFYAGRFWAQRKEALHRQVKRLSYGLIAENLDPPNQQIPDEQPQTFVISTGQGCKCAWSHVDVFGCPNS